MNESYPAVGQANAAAATSAWDSSVAFFKKAALAAAESPSFAMVSV